MLSLALGHFLRRATQTRVCYELHTPVFEVVPMPSVLGGPQDCVSKSWPEVGRLGCPGASKRSKVDGGRKYKQDHHYTKDRRTKIPGG